MRRLSLTSIALALAVAVWVPVARAELNIVPGSLVASQSSQVAGAHTDISVAFELKNHADPEHSEGAGDLVPDTDLRSVVSELPPGLVGNVEAFPKCTFSFLKENEHCPTETQVGVANFNLGEHSNSTDTLYSPIYDMVATPGSTAELAFVSHFLIPVPVAIQIHLRSDGDYGVSSTVPSLPGSWRVLRSSVTIWGDPESPVHDGERGEDKPFNPAGGCLRGAKRFENEERIEEPSGPTGELCPATLSRRPFLSNPTQCSTPVGIGLKIDSWDDPGDFLSFPGPSQLLEGCNQLEFEPTITAKPTTSLADSPSGLEFDLHIPQNEDPDGLATAQLKDSKVYLPEGLTVNPSSANGLGACSPAQVGLSTAVGDPQAHFSAAPAVCPDAAKIGTVEVDTPLLGHPLPGAVYLATPYQNPFSSLLALYITVDDPQSSVVAKIPTRIEADPSTGRLTAIVTESPQLPFADLHLDFFKGAGAPLKTSIACGTFSTTTDLTPWSSPEGADAFPSDSFTVDRGAGAGPCVGSEARAPNSPSFSAGTLDPIAGAYSPFVLRLARQDGTQRISAIDTTLPKGLIAKLAGTSYCPEAALAQAAQKSGKAEQSAPSCPAPSQIGSVQAAAGAGPTPYNTTGEAYLAGPYKGAPLSLAVITPAVAGPFDLGTVVVRVALRVDPESATVRAISDPIPHILAGIPLDLRSVTVNLDRAQFTRNPTNCDPLSLSGAALALSGQSAPLLSHFQVGECAKLGFKPKLALALKGKATRGAHPALTAILKMPSGGANIARAQVTLPHAEFLDQGHIRTICTRVQFAASQCPAGAIYGRARATTPLLDQPLEGPVYLRSSDHKLPDLVADLHGQIDVAVVGRIDSVKGAIRTSFESVPDAPVTKFTLQMQGGAKGLLQNSTNLCTSTSRATALFDGQNDKVSDSSPALEVKGCVKKKRQKGKS